MIDMRIGTPDFLGPLWWKHDTSDYDSTWTWGMNPDDHMPYFKDGGLPELITEIRSTHKRLGNGPHDWNVVVGNGATQLLFAAMSLYRRMEGVYVQAPYWFRIPEMICMAGHRFYDEVGYGPQAHEYAAVEIVTAPNNPDGMIREQKAKASIYDCCYNWPQYGGGRLFPADIQIFSLAKATGHAGSRIGWALVKDAEVAAAMTRYVEFTTGGVSREAQDRAAHLLMIQGCQRKDRTIWADAKKVLDRRWADLFSVRTPFQVLNTNGMFAWCQYGSVRPGGIEVFPGEKCGGTPLNFRLNMGVSEDAWKAFMKVVSESK